MIDKKVKYLELYSYSICLKNQSSYISNTRIIANHSKMNSSFQRAKATEIKEDKKVKLEEARRQENQSLLKQILHGQASFLSNQIWMHNVELEIFIHLFKF